MRGTTVLDLVPQRGALGPQTPAIPARIDLAVIGPMARNAADLALELSVIVSDCHEDHIGTRRAGRSPRETRLHCSPDELENA